MPGKKNEGWGWDDLFVSNCFIGSVQFYWFASLFKVFEIFSQGHFHIILKTGSCFCGHKFFLNYLIEKPTFSFSLPGPLVFIKT